jgi:methionyl-tRNA formyltransferase
VRLVFLGTPETAVPPLRALLDAGHEVTCVVTRADKRRGRGNEVTPSPVKAAAIELGLPVSHRVDDVLGSGADLGVVVAFGQLIKPHVLAEVPMVNMHFSLLPRWRGAAPVERAVLAGDDETGVCIMAVEEGLDTGGVYALERVRIRPGETADELRARLVAIGTPLLLDVLARPDAPGEAVPQEGEPTYAAKLSPDELALDWSKPAEELARLPRVGKAWTTFRGRRLLVVAAHAVPGHGEPGTIDGATTDGVTVWAGDGGLALVRVQPEGKPALDAAAWRNGARPRPGEHLGE